MGRGAQFYRADRPPFELWSLAFPLQKDIYKLHLLLSYGIESLSSGGVRLAKTNTPMLIIQKMIFLSEWIEPNVERKF